MRARFRLPVTILIASALSIAFYPPSPLAQRHVRPLKEQIRNGSMLFNARGCAYCHSVLGKGGTIGPDLSRVTVWASPILGAAVMWNHVPIMEKAMRQRGISWPKLKGEDLSDIFTYLHSLNRHKGHDIAFRGDRMKGEAVFIGAGCVKCHGKPLEGGFVGPDLGRRSRTMKTETDFAQRMLRHAAHMVGKARRLKIEWPTLRGNEMADIFAYLKSFSRK